MYTVFDFGKKDKQIEDLKNEIKQLKTEKENYKEKVEKLNEQIFDGMAIILGADYQSFLKEGVILKVSPSIKMKEDGLHYTIELYRDNECLKEFLVYNSKDNGLLSDFANSKRRIVYELTKQVAQFMINQLELYKKRIIISCTIEYKDGLTDEYAQYLELN